MAYMGTGVSLRDGIHTDSSTGISGWNTHRTALTGEFTRNGGDVSGRYGEFSKDIQEYNRKIDTLSGAWQDTGMFLTPYNAGFRYTGTGDFNKWDTYSLLLDGVDDYVDAGTALGDALGDNYAGDLTVSMWFKADVTSGHDGLFEFGAFAAANGWMMVDIASNTIRFHPAADVAWSRQVAFTDTASWHHLVCIYAAGSEADSKMYLDGIAVGTATGTFPAAADMDFAGLKTIIGAYYNTSYTFEGKMDEVAIWDSALSAAQITAIYNGGTPQSLAPYSPVAWWRMGDYDVGYIGNGYGVITDQMDTTLGSDLITNGGFDTDSDWTKGDGWTISDGVASSDGSQSASSDLYQNAGLGVDGTPYQVTFTVSNYSAGNVRAVVGGSAATIWRSANGTYTERIWVLNGPNFNIQSDYNFIGSIDNVVVKKINGYAGIMKNMTASDIVADTP